VTGQEVERIFIQKRLLKTAQRNGMSMLGKSHGGGLEHCNCYGAEEMGFWIFLGRVYGITRNSINFLRVIVIIEVVKKGRESVCIDMCVYM